MINNTVFSVKGIKKNSGLVKTNVNKIGARLGGRLEKKKKKKINTRTHMRTPTWVGDTKRCSICIWWLMDMGPKCESHCVVLYFTTLPRSQSQSELKSTTDSLTNSIELQAMSLSRGLLFHSCPPSTTPHRCTHACFSIYVSIESYGYIFIVAPEYPSISGIVQRPAECICQKGTHVAYT